MGGPGHEGKVELSVGFRAEGSSPTSQHAIFATIRFRPSHTQVIIYFCFLCLNCQIDEMEEKHRVQLLEEGNKSALLCGDLLLAQASVGLAKLR